MYLVWYIALIISVLLSLYFIHGLPVGLNKAAKEELEGGWGLTEEIRDKQKKDFLENPTEEKKAQIEYFKSHPVVFDKYTFFAVTNLVPIIFILICIALNVGYIFVIPPFLSQLKIPVWQ